MRLLEVGVRLIAGYSAVSVLLGLFVIHRSDIETVEPSWAGAQPAHSWSRHSSKQHGKARDNKASNGSQEVFFTEKVKKQ